MCVIGIISLPPGKRKIDNKYENDDEEYYNDISYGRYLQEVVEALEADDTFIKKISEAGENEIKTGHIAKNLDFVSRNVRTKLDEIKRQEMDRIRHLVKQQDDLSQGLHRKQVKIPNHLDHKNRHTFEVKDLEKLIIEATKDLEAADKKRKEEFKKYEMEKEMQRRENLKRLNEEHRKKAEEKFQEEVTRHKDHPKLHHPGTKEQFKEVWEKEDELPGEEFNLKTFFRMHDINSDGYWDMDEVKALFKTELDKMYNENLVEDDMQERMEEMERMREHVFNESDINTDGLISYKEFSDYSNRLEYEEDPGWEGLDEQAHFTQEEYEKYEKIRKEELANLAVQRDDKNTIQPPSFG